jgi:hypothetical protein
MSALFKYAVVLAAGLAIGAHLPALMSLGDVGKRAWLDPVGDVFNKALALSKPDATTGPVDLPAAARARLTFQAHRQRKELGKAPASPQGYGSVP